MTGSGMPLVLDQKLPFFLCIFESSVGQFLGTSALSNSSGITGVRNRWYEPLLRRGGIKRQEKEDSFTGN